MTTLSRRRLLGAASLLPLAAQADRPSTFAPRVLMVASQVSRIGSQTSGSFMMELAHPWERLRAAGIGIDIVTPEGGAATVYHAGAMSEPLAAIAADPLFLQAQQQSLAAVAVEASRYAAIYYPGGHGQYFDVLSDERIACLAERIHAAGGFIACAGHGGASLTPLRAGAHYLVRGMAMTCFPWWAEQAFMSISDHGARLPFDMEALLRRRGAELRVCTRETRSDPALTRVVDPVGRLISGAFAGDARWVGEQLAARLLRA